LQKKELKALNQAPRPAGKALFSPGEVMEAHACLRQAYEKGGLGRERYERMRKGLKFTDEYGRIWSIGLQTGAWYYNFDFQWHPGEPHSMLSRMDSGAQACLHCGESSPSRSAVYCIICGRPLASLPDASSIISDTAPPPRPAGRLRRRLALACLVLALLIAAALLYMILSGTVLYAGLADPLALLAAAPAVIAASRRRSGT
jgi:hypothetical protein